MSYLNSGKFYGFVPIGNEKIQTYATPSHRRAVSSRSSFSSSISFSLPSRSSFSSSISFSLPFSSIAISSSPLSLPTLPIAFPLSLSLPSHGAIVIAISPGRFQTRALPSSSSPQSISLPSHSAIVIVLSPDIPSSLARHPAAPTSQTFAYTRPSPSPPPLTTAAADISWVKDQLRINGIPDPPFTPEAQHSFR